MKCVTPELFTEYRYQTYDFFRSLRSTTSLVVITLCVIASITVILAFQPQIAQQRQQIKHHQQQQSRIISDQITSTFATVISQQLINLTLFSRCIQQ